MNHHDDSGPHDSTDQQIDLPIKSIDPDEGLEERLTDNVRHAIGPARYFVTDDGEPVEDWEGVFARVAKNVAVAELVHTDTSVTETTASDVDYGDVVEQLDAEAREHLQLIRDEFETAMREQRFMPNSPTLMNAGTELQQLSACFVNSPDDSMEDIFETATEWGLVQKTGGGMGGAFHHLRPKGARVESTGGVSSGPVSFMQLYDDVAGTVKQGGKRRGAQMAIMHCQHPDVGRFAVSKRGEESFTNFNISVGATDDFVDAVFADDTYTLYDPESGWVDSEPFETVPETVHFYDPEFEDAWNDELGKPGMGLEGKTVDENFWRDYQDQMQDPEEFDKFRHRIDLEPGEPLELPARFIWQMIVDGAHNNGEPGIFYLEETNREHSFDVETHPERVIHATNPCGEQPLCEYESCNLGHVNLSLMVDGDAPTFEQWAGPDASSDAVEGLAERYLDYALDRDLLAETVHTGVRFLDNVVTMSEFPIEEIEEQVRNMRKIGLGVMGFHQMLLQMGVEYGSELSYAIGEELMRRIDQLATEASHELAQTRGVFPDWHDSKWAEPMEYEEWFRTHAHEDPSDWKRGYPVRNHNMTTVAPTGTTSIIGDTSGGIEPIYQVCYFKNVGDDIQGDDMLVEFDDYFLRALEHNGINVEHKKAEAEELMRNNEFDGAQDLSIPDELAEVFVTTQDLDVEQHVRMQAAFQRYCDSGISKTCNLDNEASLEDVSDALLLALTEGIKGVTVYRDGSREEQVNTTRVDNELDEDELEDDELLDELVERAQEDNEFRQQAQHLLTKVPEPVELRGDD